MKKLIFTLALLVMAAGSVNAAAKENKAPKGGKTQAITGFVKVKGTDLIQADGRKLLIRGTNLGNWLNPEGYMFGFKKTNSPHLIDLMFRQAVGPDFTDRFWKRFKDNYITKADIDFIASIGANTIRLPFNYKLFTDEDYMGLKSRQDGFARIDSVVKWAKGNGIYVILDMHDCPGSQTGDNIDDGYGYPWLFESEASQQELCDIWKKIAAYYKDEPVILGYEIMNEPIAHYFDKAYFNPKLEPLMKRATAAIREVDNNHIVLIGGAQWNGNFEPFSDWKFDNNIMFTCHRYGGDASKAAIQAIIDFRDKSGLPMYMGEIGHNTDEWQATFRTVLEENNIGWTFWPYKKRDDSCINGVVMPAGWDSIVRFSEADRSSYEAIRKARPDQNLMRKAMDEYIESIKFGNCKPQTGYIKSLGFKMK